MYVCNSESTTELLLISQNRPFFNSGCEKLPELNPVVNYPRYFAMPVDVSTSRLPLASNTCKPQCIFTIPPIVIALHYFRRILILSCHAVPFVPRLPSSAASQWSP